MTITSKVRGTIAVVAAAVAVMVVAVPTAPADAAIGSMTATLRVSPVEGQPGYHWVQVFGRVPMTQPEAQRLIDSGHKVFVRLWGEDPASDDLLMGPYDAGASAYYYPAGVGFDIAHKVPNSLLNEDWGGDELYAGVRLVNSIGQTLRSAETNRVYGSF